MADQMTDQMTDDLLARFLTVLRHELPLVALWAHGSLGGGDYQPGRSDLDLIAVLSRPDDDGPTESKTTIVNKVDEIHTKLVESSPLATKLHCTYLTATELADTGHNHLTWAQEELMHRPVTPVARRELHEFGLVLYGPPPSDILPEVTDAELNAFVYQDLAEFWRPSLGSRPDLALQDIWVDLGLLTLARALVTLRDGKLITKGEALDVLIKMGAPTEVVEDIRQRRYGDPQQCTDIATDAWRRRRADLAFPFYLSEIDRVLTNYAV